MGVVAFIFWDLGRSFLRSPNAPRLAWAVGITATLLVLAFQGIVPAAAIAHALEQALKGGGLAP